MKNGIVNELITAMKERIPKGQNLANSLADILYMGKEAVYRRLRGEVAFTIDEVALLSKKLGISIDQIIGNHLSNRVTFDMNLLHSPNTLESYYEIISRYQQIFDYVKGDDTTEVYTASNLLPFTLYSSYEYMSKFRLCRWIYQNGQMKTPNSLAEMQVEDRIVKAHNKLITKAINGVPVAARFPHPFDWFSPENGQKAYEMMSCYIGLLELYKVTHNAAYLDAVQKTVNDIANTEINVAGSGSAFESWYSGRKYQTSPTYHKIGRAHV